MQMLEAVAATARKVGPYVLLEVLLPGGTLFAMTLYVYRNPETARGYVARARRSIRRTWTSARVALRRRASRIPALTTGIETALRALG